MKRLFTLILASCAITCISAKEISEQQAAAIASKLRASCATRSMSGATATLTKITGGNATLAYVYNYSGDQGFVIVAGDDRVGKVLAYSPTGKFDLDNLAPATRAWLDVQKNDVLSVVSGGAVVAAANDEEYVYDTAVEPLCTSQWSQGAPYYNLCPLQTNSKGEKEHAATGCVATAMAQILYYWKYPQTGTGSNTIETYDGQTLTVDFSQSNYDWANMSDTYDSTSSEASQAAVAKLMYDCGVAASMNYYVEGSGARELNAANALVNNFNMDKGLKTRYAESYRSYAEWCNLIKSEIDSLRPVFYGGLDIVDGGHAFVCDGYDRAGLFHINWGWGGFADGYYTLRTLQPTYKDGNGNTVLLHSFSAKQQILIGVKPAEANSQAHPYTITSDEIKMLVNDSENRKLYVSISSLMNGGYGTFTGNFLLTLYDSEGNRAYECPIFSSDVEVETEMYFSNLAKVFDVSSLPNGEYSVHIYSKEYPSGYEEMVGELRDFFPQTLTVSDGGLTINEPRTISVKVIGCEVSGDDEQGRTLSATISITNESEQYDYNGWLMSYFLSSMDTSDPNTETVVGDKRLIVFVAPGQTSDEITFKFDGIKSKSGYLVISNHNTRGDILRMPVELSATGISNVGADGDGRVVVSDLQGRTVFSGKSSVESALRGLASGVYVVKSGNNISKVLVK